MNMTATYSPEDNKLRLYSESRLSPELYARVKVAGFTFAPRQELFVAPMWTPGREDLLIELCGEIDDEDTSLVDRAEERRERFTEYSEHRAEDADRAQKAVEAITEHIPMGQPILIGHHSERRARKDAQRIEDGMRRAVKMWDTATYWTDRAAGAVRNAKHKERPDVRARRIRRIEVDKRRQERTIAELTKYKAALLAVSTHARTIAYASRWVAHYENRLAYERVILAADGGTLADRNKPEKGGACRCVASPREGWSYIQKVNRVTVSVLHNYSHGGQTFTRTVPFDKLSGIMSAAAVEQNRSAGLLIESDQGAGIGFHIISSPATPTEDLDMEDERKAKAEAEGQDGGEETAPPCAACNRPWSAHATHPATTCGYYWSADDWARHSQLASPSFQLHSSSLPPPPLPPAWSSWPTFCQGRKF